MQKKLENNMILNTWVVQPILLHALHVHCLELPLRSCIWATTCETVGPINISKGQFEPKPHNQLPFHP